MRERKSILPVWADIWRRRDYGIHFISIYMMMYGKQEVPLGDGSQPWVWSASLGASNLFEAKLCLIFLILTEHTWC